MKTLGKKYPDFWKIEAETFQAQTFWMIVFHQIS